MARGIFQDGLRVWRNKGFLNTSEEVFEGLLEKLVYLGIFVNSSTIF